MENTTAPNSTNFQTPQNIAEILRVRAKELARREPTVEGGHTFVDALHFLLAGETYAITTEFLEDVFPLRDVTPVPCTPPYVIGIVAVRGQIFSVINLKTLFEIPDDPESQMRYVVLIAHGGMTFGIAVDSVLDVQPIATDILQPPPPTVVGFKADYVRGLTDEPVIVLDAKKMLNDTRIVVQETVK